MVQQGARLYRSSASTALVPVRVSQGKKLSMHFPSLPIPSNPNFSLKLKSRSLTATASFPVPNTNLRLDISDLQPVRRRLKKSAVRNVLWAAYEFADNLIDVAGDGLVPSAALPYETGTWDVCVGVLATTGAGVNKLRWSDFRSTMWGLRDFMVLQDHLFAIDFGIVRVGDGEIYLGAGYVGLSRLPQTG